MLNLEFKVAKAAFFDRQAILSPAAQAEKKILSRFGAYCMKAARNSIKQASNYKQRSQPGKPPLKHGWCLGYAGFDGSIFFVWDRAAHSVTIGAIVLKGGRNRYRGQRGASDPVPAILEYGGFVPMKGGRMGQVKARPYMKPAFLKTVDKLAGMLSECITNESANTGTFSLKG